MRLRPDNGLRRHNLFTIATYGKTEILPKGARAFALRRTAGRAHRRPPTGLVLTANAETAG